MKKSVVPYADTGNFTKAVTDYISGQPAIKPFYSYKPDTASIPDIIANRNKFPLFRMQLHAALMRQYAPFQQIDSKEETAKNIERLKDSNTFTVVTAHQPNLFLGPLYLIYKIISAINLSRRLNRDFPGFHFIPVYWMGSEDHDKEELNHIHLFSKRITWTTDQEGAFGRMKTTSLDDVVAEIKWVLGDTEEARRCVRLLEECYLQELTIAAATKKILYHFFADDGLVIVDGDDGALKQLFMPVIRQELSEQFSFDAVKKTSAVFAEHYQTQIAPREINLFYLDDDRRQRIVKEHDQWKVLNTSLSFSWAELMSLVERGPEQFSPNVVLRPVYQEMILPNIAFIGGGAEVTYWMQLKAVFAAAGVAFPMLLLRNSVLWVDQGNAMKMSKTGISTAAIFQSTDVLINSYLSAQTGDIISLASEKQQLNELMQKALQRALQLDASLKGAVEAETVKMQKSMESLEDKMKKAARRKEEVAIQQLRTLKEKLFPSGSLQERHDNFLPYYMKYGDQFFSALKKHLDPMERQFTILTEE